MMQSGQCAGDSQHMPCHSRTGVRWWTNREAHAEGRAGIPQVQGQEEFMAQGLCCFQFTHCLLCMVCQFYDCTSHNRSRCFKMQSYSCASELHYRKPTCMCSSVSLMVHFTITRDTVCPGRSVVGCVPLCLCEDAEPDVQFCLVGSWCGYEPCRAPSRWW